MKPTGIYFCWRCRQDVLELDSNGDCPKCHVKPNPVFEVWDIRYPLTAGIIKRQAVESAGDSNGMLTIVDRAAIYADYLHRKDYRKTRKEAVKAAIETLVRKKKSLERSRKRVDAIQKLMESQLESESNDDIRIAERS